MPNIEFQNFPGINTRNFWTKIYEAQKPQASKYQVTELKLKFPVINELVQTHDLNLMQILNFANFIIFKLSFDQTDIISDPFQWIPSRN